MYNLRTNKNYLKTSVYDCHYKSTITVKFVAISSYS